MFQAVKTEAYPSREALAGRIDFAVQLRNTNNQRYAILDARAAVYVRTPGGGRAYVDQAFLFQQNGFMETSRGGEMHVRLAMPVTNGNAVLLEETRGNQKVHFELEVVVLAHPLDGAPSNQIPPRAEVRAETRIEKSQWVEEFLPAFGMDNHDLWEMRFPRLPTPETLQQEADLLKKALHDYNMGEYLSCYQHCRQVVESLNNREGELGLSRYVGEQEWGRASNYLSIALHADNEISKKIVRRDAEFALSLTRAILHRVATALASPEEKTRPARTPAMVPSP